MKNALLIFLALCTLGATMIPRDRRALNIEEDGYSHKETFCEPQTPCAWTVYKGTSKILEATIPNTYCNCIYDTTCQESEFDAGANTVIYRCRASAKMTES